MSINIHINVSGKASKIILSKDAPDTYADELLESLIVPAKLTSSFLKKCAPLAFDSLNRYNQTAVDCRIGTSVWSGFTCSLDGAVKPHK